MPSQIVTATTQAAGLSAASNICAQIIGAYQAQRPFSLDVLQLARFIFLTILTAPPNYHWQQLLERAFPANARAQGLEGIGSRDPEKGELDPDAKGRGDGAGSKPRLNLRNTLTKWFVDCITLGAILNTIAFLVLMGLMKGQGVGTIGHNIRTETIPIIVAGYKIWPLASIVSFSFVPVEKRIVFLSFIGLLWGIYMSLVAAEI